jgi:hypothetical protein
VEWNQCEDESKPSWVSHEEMVSQQIDLFLLNHVQESISLFQCAALEIRRLRLEDGRRFATRGKRRKTTMNP